MPIQNPFIAIDGEAMPPVTARTEVQCALTEEGNTLFKLANWPEAGEAYLAAIQLAVLDMDAGSATQ